MSGARVLVKKVKMRVPAGNATAAPPVGPTLGQAGVNLMDFCKLFNARTQKYKEGIKLPPALALRISQACSRNLRRALLTLEACKVSKPLRLPL